VTNWARESCRAIREPGVFGSCQGSVDPDLFYEMCLQVITFLFIEYYFQIIFNSLIFPELCSTYSSNDCQVMMVSFMSKFEIRRLLSMARQGYCNERYAL
jgi:hypothetical protein